MLAASSDKYSTEIILSHDEIEGEIYLGPSKTGLTSHTCKGRSKKGPETILSDPNRNYLQRVEECVTLIFGETEKHLRQDSSWLVEARGWFHQDRV